MTPDDLEYLDNNLIEVFVDKSCDMACVKFNGEFVLEGNYWDFHPGCHGDTGFPEYSSYHGLVSALELICHRKGYHNVSVVESSYKSRNY